MDKIQYDNRYNDSYVVAEETVISFYSLPQWLLMWKGSCVVVRFTTKTSWTGHPVATGAAVVMTSMTLRLSAALWLMEFLPYKASIPPSAKMIQVGHWVLWTCFCLFFKEQWRQMTEGWVPGKNGQQFCLFAGAWWGFHIITTGTQNIFCLVSTGGRPKVRNKLPSSSHVINVTDMSDSN